MENTSMEDMKRELNLLTLIDKFHTHPKVLCEFLSLREKTKFSSIDDKVALFLDFAEINFPIRPSVGKSNDLSREYRTKGNQYFTKDRNLVQALKYYNMAIGQAENSSVEISLAYANRSAINFESGRFEDAVIDVDRALQGNYPEELKFKIIERKSRCFVKLHNYSAAASFFKEALEFLAFFNESDSKKTELKSQIKREMAKIKNKKDVANKDDEMAPKLTDPPSEIIYCASEAVKIDSCPSMGRVIVATKNINIGDVLAIEKAFASDLEEEHLLNFCFDCKRKCFSMLPCLKCTQVFYCDENCRSRSWDTEHMIECDIISTIRDLGLGYALKVLLKMTKQGHKLQKFFDKEERYLKSNEPFPGFKNGKYSANKTSMMNLHFNEKFFHSENVAIMVLYACIYVSALKTTEFFNFVENEKDMHLKVGRLLTLIICQAKSNVFGAGCNGKTFLPFMSLLGHSCDPNSIVARLDNDSSLLIAVDHIPKGQQITISYGPDFYMSEQDRQTIFEARGFICGCYACETKWPPADLMPNPGLLKQSVSVQLIDDCIVEFRDTYNYYLHHIQGVEGAKALLKHSHLDNAIRLGDNLSKYLRKPSQILYACKSLIISITFDLVANKSFKFK